MEHDLIRGRAADRHLPSPLEGVDSPADWLLRRRRELRQLFEERFFGALPPRPAEVAYLTERETPCFGGLGLRRDVAIRLRNGGREHRVKALWYLPAAADAAHPAPLAIGLNFKGNAACTPEPDVEMDESEPRGSAAEAWQIPYLLERGLSLITAPRNRLFPDRADGRADSIYRLFLPDAELTPEHRDATAISAWAWGCQRLLELGLTEPRIDAGSIWVMGHSRLGKTALWAAANEPRFAGVAAIESGCCGAAIARDSLPESEHFRQIGQTFPWWFRRAFDDLAGREAELAFDMHFLSALAAPRPLLIASAVEDVWADPFNEFRNAAAVGEVYRFLGADGLPEGAVFPAPDRCLRGDKVWYHLRSGKHCVRREDWEVIAEYILQTNRQKG